jgi:hypothetical protein
MNGKRSGCGQGLAGTIPPAAQSDLPTPQTNSVRILSILVDIQTQHFSNMSQVCYQYANASGIRDENGTIHHGKVTEMKVTIYWDV